jgi:DNA-binding MarR family transcriptional regulator
MGATKLRDSGTAKVTAEVAEWRDLLARHAAVNCALERELAGHELGVSEYEVLERLAEVTDCSARAQQLAGEVHLSQSALSRVIARLEKAGLVERAICVDDRRGIFVKLTQDGRTRQAEAQPTHRKVLSEHLH